MNPSRPLRAKVALTAAIAMLALAGVLFGIAELRDTWRRTRFLDAMAQSDANLVRTIQSLETAALQRLNLEIAVAAPVGALLTEGDADLAAEAEAAIKGMTETANPRPGALLLEPDGSVALATGVSEADAAAFAETLKPLLGHERRFGVAAVAPDGALALLAVSEARRGADMIGYVVSVSDLGARVESFHRGADALGVQGRGGTLTAISGEAALLTEVKRPCCVARPEGGPIRLQDRLFHSVTIPILDAEGVASAEIFTLRDITQGHQREQRIWLLAVVAAAMTSLLAIGLMLGSLRNALRPLGAAVKVLRRMSDGDTGVGLKPLRSAREIEVLVETVDAFRVSLEAQKSLAALTEQLESARRIQQALLPQEFNLAPGLDIHGAMRPAQDVGGDFFDVFALDEGRVAVVVADVSGKGVGAALFAALASTALRSNARVFSDPAAIIRATNDELCLRNREDMFISVFLAIFDGSTGEATYVNAGHCPPFLLSAAESQAVESEGDLVLGIMPEMDYALGRLTLAPGETLLVYSDGFDEAQRDDLAQIGGPGALAIAGRHVDEGAAALVGSIFDDIDAFVDGAPQADDITLLAIRRVSPAPGGGPDRPEAPS